MYKTFLLSLAITAFSNLMAFASVDFYDNGFAYSIISETEKLCALEPNEGHLYTGDITIPSEASFNGTTYSVYRVNSYSFYNCNELTSLTVPATLKSFSIDVFKDNASLSRLIVEDSEDVLSVGYSTFDSSGFFHCAPITYFYMGRNISLQYSKSHTFPSFRFLEEVYMSDNVTEIADGFFEGAQITKIRFSPLLKSIGSSSFNQGYKASTLVLPNELTSIGTNAFYGCRNVLEVTLGEKVKSINSYAFSDCSKLAAMYVFATTPPTAAYYTFDSNNIAGARLRVPGESVELYKNSSQWKSFGEILPLNDGSVAPNEPLKYKILFPESGSISQNVKDGQVLSFHISPNNGWVLHSMSENGVVITDKIDENGVFTTDPIHQDTELNIVFKDNTNTDIEQLSIEPLISVFVRGKTLSIHGSYDTARLFKIDGTLVGNNIESTFEIESNGVYILNVDNSVFKFAIGR